VLKTAVPISPQIPAKFFPFAMFFVRFQSLKTLLSLKRG
jgi:hypothetical protein